MKVIPESAASEDPVWSSALGELAVELVRAGCKAKIIKRYTGVSHKRIASLFRSIHDADAPGGPCHQGDAQFFVTGTNSNRFSGPAWNIEGAVFLGSYRKLAAAVGVKANRGWLLLHAFRSYLCMTKALADRNIGRRLDINQAYALLVFSGFNTLPELSEIGQKVCGKCLTQFLIDNRREPESQACPVCIIRLNTERLASQSRRTRASANG